MTQKKRLGQLLLSTGLVIVASVFSSQANAERSNSKVDVPALTKRAFEGNANAQYALASLYERGENGVKKDLAYAVSWYEEAAHNGLKVASEKLRILGDTP